MIYLNNYCTEFYVSTDHGVHNIINHHSDSHNFQDPYNFQDTSVTLVC